MELKPPTRKFGFTNHPFSAGGLGFRVLTTWDDLPSRSAEFSPHQVGSWQLGPIWGIFARF